MLNGPSGSGKSNLFKVLLTQVYPGIFDNVYLFCPTFFNDATLNDLVKYEENEYVEDNGELYEPKAFFKATGMKREQLEEHGFSLVTRREVSKHSSLREEDVITESDPKLLLEIFEKKWAKCMRDFAADPFAKSLFIIDDLSIELRNSVPLKNYFTKGRKGGISMMIMSNQYKTYAPAIRNQCTHYALFKPATTLEMLAMLEDHFGGRWPNKKDAENVFTRAVRDRGDFVYIDKTAPEAEQFRRKFDTIIAIKSA